MGTAGKLCVKPGFNDGLSEPRSTQRCVRVSGGHPVEISWGLLTSGDTRGH